MYVDGLEDDFSFSYIVLIYRIYTGTCCITESNRPTRTVDS